MKKLITSLLLICSMICATVYCSADSIYTPENITIIYQEDSVWTEQQKEQFFNLILSGQTESVPYSLLCVFGHDTVTEYHHVIKHKALSVEPRCANQYYEVITCTRCDYMDATLVSNLFIYCCPED